MKALELSYQLNFKAFNQLRSVGVSAYARIGLKVNVRQFIQVGNQASPNISNHVVVEADTLKLW